MPKHPTAWNYCATLLRIIAIGKVPTSAMSAIHSGGALALDRPELNKGRPLALGNPHRRLASKAVSYTPLTLPTNTHV